MLAFFHYPRPCTFPCSFSFFMHYASLLSLPTPLHALCFLLSLPTPLHVPLPLLSVHALCKGGGGVGLPLHHSMLFLSFAIHAFSVFRYSCLFFLSLLMPWHVPIPLSCLCAVNAFLLQSNLVTVSTISLDDSFTITCIHYNERWFSYENFVKKPLEFTLTRHSL